MIKVLSDEEKQAIKDMIKATDISDLKSVEDLKERLAFYINWQGRTSFKPVKLATLNRRFGVVARELGYSIRQAVEALALSGVIGMHVRPGGFVLSSNVAVESLYVFIPENQPMKRADALDIYLNKAE